jgi:hypothetical protein
VAERRFELDIGPLVARLGFTRPDEQPFQGADCVYPVLLYGDYGGAATSPGSRVCSASAVAGPLGGQLSAIYFSPPAGGCWLHSFSAVCSAGSDVIWWTDNQVATPALLASGSSSVEARWDNREVVSPPSLVETGTFVSGFPLALNSLIGEHKFIRPVWWSATRFCLHARAPNESLNGTIVYEPPLVGMRRQTT